MMNDYLKEINNNNISKREADKIQIAPMTDRDISKYFTGAKIINYSELGHYSNINELLPSNPDFVFLLYEQDINIGHWVLLSKYIYNNATNPIIEYFDSYGGEIDSPLQWTPQIKRKELGIYKPYLTDLLAKCNYDVIYNTFDFQNDKNYAISTCGRWCSLRLHTILNDDMSLQEFVSLMKNLKRITKRTFDNIVSDIISK